MEHKPRKHTHPRTPEQWQEAVDLAEFYLHLDAARKYGLVKGGPEVDVARCEQLLARGARKGYKPSDGCVQRITVQMMASQEEGATNDRGATL